MSSESTWGRERERRTAVGGRLCVYFLGVITFNIRLLKKSRNEIKLNNTTIHPRPKIGEFFRLTSLTSLKLSVDCSTNFDWHNPYKYCVFSRLRWLVPRGEKRIVVYVSVVTDKQWHLVLKKKLEKLKILSGKIKKSDTRRQIRTRKH